MINCCYDSEVYRISPDFEVTYFDGNHIIVPMANVGLLSLLALMVIIRCKCISLYVLLVNKQDEGKLQITR